MLCKISAKFRLSESYEILFALLSKRNLIKEVFSLLFPYFSFTFVRYNLLSSNTMKNKWFIAFAFLAIVCGSVYGKSLVLTLNDGGRVYYLLGGDVDPMMRFVDGGMTVNADGYAFADIKNFCISDEDDPNGVEQILSRAGASYKGNMVCMQVSQEVPVKVCTLDGRSVQVTVRVVDDVVCVDLNALPTGIYMVSIGNTSLKVIKE